MEEIGLGESELNFGIGGSHLPSELQQILQQQLPELRAYAQAKRGRKLFREHLVLEDKGLQIKIKSYSGMVTALQLESRGEEGYHRFRSTINFGTTPEIPAQIITADINGRDKTETSAALQCLGDLPPVVQTQLNQALWLVNAKIAAPWGLGPCNQPGIWLV